jgi:hypothetical protein
MESDVEPATHPHLFTASEYTILDIETRTELIGGVIYDLSPRNEPHIFAVGRLIDALAPGFLGSEYVARFQEALAVSGWDAGEAPEIDVAVVRRKRYDATPTASDAFTFVEVSDSTYRGKRGDRTYRIPLYVNAGVPSWIVNIPLRQVEFYGNVPDLSLEHGHVFSEDDSFNILGVLVPVADLFVDSLT